MDKKEIEEAKKKENKEKKNQDEKIQHSELELFLLKEQLGEKDIEIKRLKETNKHIFTILEELTRVETKLLETKTLT